MVVNFEAGLWHARSHISVMDSSGTADISLAHGLLRLGLGVNILMHGISRLPDLAGFTHHLEQTMSRTWLPLPLVTATGYTLPFAELILGGLLTVGLLLRPVLIAGTFLIIVLTFGVCLAQNWAVASEQLIYLLVYVALLAALRYDRFSVDHMLFGRRN
jgi:thiosulfate dehydrogenase (quinone) large subunit